MKLKLNSTSTTRRHNTWWIMAVASVSIWTHAIARVNQNNHPSGGFVAGAPPRIVEFDPDAPETWYFTASDADSLTALVTCLTADAVVKYLDMYRVNPELRASIQSEFEAYEREQKLLDDRWNQHLKGDAFQMFQTLDLELDPPPTIHDLLYPGMDHIRPPVATAPSDDPRRETLQQLQLQIDKERQPLIDALDALNERTINAIHTLVFDESESAAFAEASVSRLMQEGLRDGRWKYVGRYQDAPIDFGRLAVSEAVEELLCQQLQEQMGQVPELPMEKLALTTELHHAMITYDLLLSSTVRSNFLNQKRFARRSSQSVASDDLDESCRRAGREWATRQKAADDAFELLQATLAKSIVSFDEDNRAQWQRELERLFYAGMGEWHARLHWGERLSDWWAAKGEAPNAAISEFCEARRRDAAEFRRQSFVLIRECGRKAGTALAITDRTFGERCQLVGLIESYLETQRGHAEAFKLLVPTEMHAELRRRFAEFEARFTAVLFECRGSRL